MYVTEKERLYKKRISLTGSIDEVITEIEDIQNCVDDSDVEVYVDVTETFLRLLSAENISQQKKYDLMMELYRSYPKKFKE